MSPLWTETELNRALKLRDAGLSFAEIGQALSRPAEGVRKVILKARPHKRKPVNVDPIGTDEERRFHANAINGSQKLLAEIERVFGRAA